MLDLGESPHEGQWEPMVSASGDEVEFQQRYVEFNEENVIKFLTLTKMISETKKCKVLSLSVNRRSTIAASKSNHRPIVVWSIVS